MASKPPNIPLPKAWSNHIKSGILHVISLARIALVAASGLTARAARRTFVFEPSWRNHDERSRNSKKNYG